MPVREGKVAALKVGRGEMCRTMSRCNGRLSGQGVSQKSRAVEAGVLSMLLFSSWLLGNVVVSAYKAYMVDVLRFSCSTPTMKQESTTT